MAFLQGPPFLDKIGFLWGWSPMLWTCLELVSAPLTRQTGRCAGMTAAPEIWSIATAATRADYNIKHCAECIHMPHSPNPLHCLRREAQDHPLFTMEETKLREVKQLAHGRAIVPRAPFTHKTIWFSGHSELANQKTKFSSVPQVSFFTRRKPSLQIQSTILESSLAKECMRLANEVKKGGLIEITLHP